METTGDRIKKIRKDIKLSQSEFGERIGLGRDVIGNIECNRVDIKEYISKLICYEYNVNEIWLKTGEGDIYKLPSDKQSIDNILLTAIVNDNSKIKEIVKGLSLLDDKYIDAIVTLINGLLNK